MKRHLLAAGATGVAVLAVHAAYAVWRAHRVAALWSAPDRPNALSLYLENGDVLLGLSYGLAGAFTAYALAGKVGGRKGGAAGAAGGVTLAGFLYFAGCFLTGCCGSPLLGVYAGLFGSRFLGAAKPLVFGLTAVSVALGWWCLERQARKKEGPGGEGGCCDG